LILTELFISPGAFYGGILLMMDPTGALLQLPYQMPENIFFGNYFVPGMFLILINGILPLLIAAGLIFRPKWRIAEALNLYKTHHWVWIFCIYQALGLIIWMSIQLFIIGDYFFLQPIYLLIAVLIITLTLLPSVNRYYKKQNS
jgi:magnesium-transporting ATPase (P-type)